MICASTAEFHTDNYPSCHRYRVKNHPWASFSTLSTNFFASAATTLYQPSRKKSSTPHKSRQKSQKSRLIIKSAQWTLASAEPSFRLTSWALNQTLPCSKNLAQLPPERLLYFKSNSWCSPTQLKIKFMMILTQTQMMKLLMLVN